MSTPGAVLSLHSRVSGAIYGMYIGDALSMPVHWYYDVRRIKADFGAQGITTYREPVKKFPGSIMNLSNTGGGGRGSDKGNIIGDVLVKGKKDLWTRGGDYHYHHGYHPGENTLDTLIARLLMKSILLDSKGGAVDGPKFLERYIAYMEAGPADRAADPFAENSHHDVYVATAHRMFFANYSGKKKAPMDSADNDGHNTDSIDALINIVPLALRDAVMGQLPREQDASKTDEIGYVINLTRDSQALPRYGVLTYELLRRVLLGEDLRKAVLAVATLLDRSGNLARRIEDAASGRKGDDPMTACYVDSSFPVMLTILYKYADDPNAAVLASANAGGENVNRSAILGAVMGAAHGKEKWDEALVDGLHYGKAYEKEVPQFLAMSAEAPKRAEL